MLDEKQISTESEIKEAITFDENFEDVSSLVENLEKFTPEELEGIPKIVLEVVPLTDDPSLPAFTFRYWVLATVFTVLGAFIGQMTWFRTSSAPFSMFFVQITSYWIGGLMAKVLPTSTFKVFGKEFSLNPGPFNTKEHVLIVVAVSSVAGAGSFAEIVISVKDLFYNEPMHPAAGVFLMLCSNLMGFSFAGFA
ncbi:OPT oligopeptide transporter protein-domain-containing protein, partial [Endogone sp. FLAS-F59071]